MLSYKQLELLFDLKRAPITSTKWTRSYRGLVAAGYATEPSAYTFQITPEGLLYLRCGRKKDKRTIGAQQQLMLHDVYDRGEQGKQFVSLKDSSTKARIDILIERGYLLSHPDYKNNLMVKLTPQGVRWVKQDIQRILETVL